MRPLRSLRPTQTADILAVSALGTMLALLDGDEPAARTLVEESARELLGADVVLWWAPGERTSTRSVVDVGTPSGASVGTDLRTADDAVFATFRTGVASLPRGSSSTRRVLVPVSVVERTVGVLDATAPADRDDLDAGDVAVLLALAERLGTTISSWRLRRELQHRVEHDVLTGLPNRTLLMAHLGAAIDACAAGASTLCVLFLDVDRFKLVNDTRGHAMGDGVLRAVADRLRDQVRDGDFVARFGGDEFVVVICDDGGPAELEPVLDRLTDAITDPITVERDRLFVSLSGGLARWTVGEDAETVLRHADVAMYQAKLSPGSRWCEFVADHHLDAARKLGRESDPHDALANDELFCDYQPIVDLSTGRPVAHEALARWSHPRLGRVPPSDFIPLAESTDLIFPLTEQVLGRALDAATGWPDDVAVSINLSARHLGHRRLVPFVLDTLESRGFAPGRLILEITETAVMVERDRAMTNLDTLHAEGVCIAVDDFGSGFTSIEDLSRIPLSLLKIDQAFVREAHTERGRDMLRALHSLAAALDLTTVTEGVETAEQLEIVRDMGCTLSQGFLLGRPVAPGQVSHDRVDALPVLPPLTLQA